MPTLPVLALVLLAGAGAGSADGKARLAGTWSSELAGKPLNPILTADGKEYAACR